MIVTATVMARPVSVTATVTPRVTTARPASMVTMATQGRRPSCVAVALVIIDLNVTISRISIFIAVCC